MKGSIEMRVFAALLFSSAVVLAPALASAQETTAPAAPAAQTAQAAPATTDISRVNLDEIVCKQQPPATGSRLGGGRECHTVREWNQRQKDAQDTTRQQEMGGYSRPGG
jgi:hypothetical protein